MMKKLLVTAITISLTSLALIMLYFAGCDRILNPNVPVSLKWRYDTGYYKYHSLEMVDDVIYVSYPNGYIYAIDKNAGKQKWEFHERDGGFTSCSVIDGVVYVGRWGTPRTAANLKEINFLYAIDAKSGELRWCYDLSGYEGIRYVRKPTVVDGTVYVGSPDNHMYAIDAKRGELKWRFGTGVDFIVSTPSVVDNVVYYITKKYFYAIDANDGKLKLQWKAEDKLSNMMISVTVANGVSYIGVYNYGTEDASLYAVDANSGELKWQYKTGWVSFPPTVVNGVIYVGSRNLYLYALDTNSGELIWKYKMRDRAFSSPTVADGVVYVCSRDKNLYAVNANSGRLMWKYRAGDYPHSNIIVDDGVIYFGSSDGYLYALEIMKNNQ